MRKLSSLTLLLIFFFLLLCFITASPSFSDIKAEDRLKNLEEEFERKWRESEAELQKTWLQMERRQEETYQRAKEEIEKKWDRYVESSKKIWVDYYSDANSMSKVNFEKGYIEVTSIVPITKKDMVELGKERLKRQIKKLFSEDNLAKMEVLADQVKNEEGQVVTKDNLEQFIKEEVPKKVRVEKPFRAKDEVERVKLKLHIDMVPNHIYVRAKKYLPLVEKNSQRFNIKPQLILAIIHTESYFNPLAESPCGAYGLMQLIPRYAGREAYLFLYKKDKVITSDYLYLPENNVELGTAYLYLLKNKHFSDMREELKNMYLVICGYNCGPTAINKRITERYTLSRITSHELYRILRLRTPKETRDYLKKVIQRMPIYEPLMNR